MSTLTKKLAHKFMKAAGVSETIEAAITDSKRLEQNLKDLAVMTEQILMGPASSLQPLNPHPTLLKRYRNPLKG